MIFRQPKSYSITLKRAHSLLKIPRNSTSSTSIGLNSPQSNVSPSREQILEGFRRAAKRHHPDLAKASKCRDYDAKKIFVECQEARELMLDYYVRRKFLNPKLVESTKDRFKWEEESSLFSVWTSNRAFQIEVCLRYAVCLGLAVATYHHDKNMPKKRKLQIKRRDEGFSQFGPAHR